MPLVYRQLHVRTRSIGFVSAHFEIYLPEIAGRGYRCIAASAAHLRYSSASAHVPCSAIGDTRVQRLCARQQLVDGQDAVWLHRCHIAAQ